MSTPVTVHAAFVAVEGGMGQQIADSSLIAALHDAPGVDVRPYPVGSMRTRLDVRRRLPLGPLDRAPYAVKRLAGTVSYPRTLVHRFDCRLPPAPREIVTVHDLAPLRFPDEGLWPRDVGPSLRRALAVVCPSQFSADEVHAEYGLSNVHVVPNGLDPAFLDPSPLAPARLEKFGLPSRYVLHTGGATARKNLAALASAWPAVRSAFPDVVLAMSGPSDSRRNSLFESLPGVRLLGKLPRPTLVGLMAAAAAVVVPSRYEGYGLPAAEAMACGVPVVATSCASLPEVVGEHGCLIDPNADGLADGLCSALNGVDQQVLTEGRAVARARTWQASAARYAQIYREVMGERTGMMHMKESQRPADGQPAQATCDGSDPSANTLTLSVALVTWRRAQFVQRCLESLVAQNRLPNEIVVVDASEDDSTRDVVARFPGVEYIRFPGGAGNTPAARNEALRHVGGDIIAFLDDDTCAHVEWSARLLDSFNKQDVAAVAGRTLNGQPGEDHEGVDRIGLLLENGQLTGYFAADPGEPVAIHHGIGANMAFRRQWLARLGGLRDVFPGTQMREETDLFVRVRALGGVSVFDPLVVVDHLPAPHAKGQRFDLRYAYYAERNHLQFLAMNYGCFSSILRRYLIGVVCTLRGTERERRMVSRLIRAGLRLGGALVGLVAALRMGAWTALSPIRDDEVGQAIRSDLSGAQA